MREWKREKGRASLFVLLGIFWLMWALNAMTPMFADDYIYVLNLRTEQPLQDLGDVLHSISRFRSMHNGRVAAHFFAQLFLLLPRGLFRVVNAAMCALLFFSLSRYLKSEEPRCNARLLFALFALVFLLMPGFGHSFLWLTGSCSYLWAITFLSFFIYPFYGTWLQGRQWERLRGSIPWLRELLALAYAFFAGAYSENGAFSALAVCFCFLALLWWRDRKLPLQLLLRFAAGCAGFLFLMLSPSELGKKNNTGGDRPESLLMKLWQLVEGKALLLVLAALLLLLVLLWAFLRHRRTLYGILLTLTGIAVPSLTVLLLPAELSQAEDFLTWFNLFLSDTKISLLLMFGLWFGLLLLALLWKADLQKILAALVLGLGAMASLAVFLVAIYFPARGACVATVYTSLASLLLLMALGERRGGKLVKGSVLFLSLLFVPALLAGLSDSRSVLQQDHQRMECIIRAKEEGLSELELEPLVSVGKYSAVWTGEAADYYFGMEAYYGIPRMTIRGAVEF